MVQFFWLKVLQALQVRVLWRVLLLGDRFVAACLRFPMASHDIGGGFRHGADIAVAVEVAGKWAD